MIRVMETPDLDRVLEIEGEVYTSPWTRRVFEDEMAHVTRRYFVVESSGRVVGFGGLMLVGPESHVVTLAVDPANHGQGVGSKLLRKLFEVSVQEGARHLTLEVRASNHPARSLYQRFGFEEVGVRKGYYGDEDAVIMFVHDIDAPSGQVPAPEVSNG